MSIFRYNPKNSIIICHCEITGPKLSLALKMAVDTGATYTMISVEAAIAVGCDPFTVRRRIEMTTGSGVEYVPVIIIPEFKTLGVKMTNLEVVCHNLPVESPVEGLLGLNFLNHSKLLIDFSRHVIIPAL